MEGSGQSLAVRIKSRSFLLITDNRPLPTFGHPSAFIPHPFRVTLGTHFELTIRSVSHRKSA